MHLGPTKDAKREPYMTKGYAQNTRMQKPKQALNFYFFLKSKQTNKFKNK
jgi:hypothetical protein